MIRIKEGVKIFVSIEPIDARKSIDSLTCLIPDKFGDNPQSGKRRNVTLSLNDIAENINPVIRGWINYYGNYNLLRENQV